MQLGFSSSTGSDYRRTKSVAYIALVLGIAALVCVATLSVVLVRDLNQLNHATTTTTLAPITITGMLITPPLSLPDAPPILVQQPFGQRLTNINVPLNSTQLSVINNGPDAYFATAAKMYVNNSLSIVIGQQIAPAPLFTVNGKPSVTYLGAISCVYCGENRWAMALALSRFGSFQNLFFGYSSLGDGDIPTLYWAPAHYNATSAVDWGNFYSGNYVNFISIEYASPITAGFRMQTLNYFQQQAKTLNNSVYESATNLIVNLNNFVGTPYTIWEKYVVLGADASNFGDTTSTATTTSSTTFPIASMTHDQILASFAHPTTQFAWNEYAAADYYVALICASLGVVAGASSAAMAPPICSDPSIATMTVQARG